MKDFDDPPVDEATLALLDKYGWKVVRKHPLLDRVQSIDVEMPWPTAKKTWLQNMNRSKRRG